VIKKFYKKIEKNASETLGIKEGSM